MARPPISVVFDTNILADVIDLFLREFRVIEITRQVARRAVDIRRRTRVRVPDAIVWAAAPAESAVLVTRNTKDFPADDPGVRVPYQGRWCPVPAVALRCAPGGHD